MTNTLITDPVEIQRWLEEHHWLPPAYIIHEDGIVDINGDVSFAECNTFPFQFGEIIGSFTSGETAKSLQGCPVRVHRRFSCRRTPDDNIKYFPEYIGTDFHLQPPKSNSLSGIHKRVKYIGGTVFFPECATHLLGLILIEHVGNLRCVGSVQGVHRSNAITNILNKHLESKDIIAAQDELMDAGCMDQARL